MVFLLQKSMYGIQKAGRIWCVVIINTLFERGFKQSVAEPRLLFYTEVEAFIIIVIFVENMAFVSNSSKNSRRRWQNRLISSENWKRLLDGKLVKTTVISRYHKADMYHLFSPRIKWITSMPHILWWRKTQTLAQYNPTRNSYHPNRTPYNVIKS